MATNQPSTASSVGSSDSRNRAEQYHEYLALVQDAGIIPFDEIGVLRVEGRDRVSWLQKLVSINVEALAEGSGAYGLLLNGSAHVVADFILLAQTDSLLLYSSRTAHEKLKQGLRRALFREKVTLSDVSDTLALIAVHGPRASDLLNRTWPDLPHLDGFQFDTRGSSLILCYPLLPSPTFDIMVPKDQLSQIRDALMQAGAQPVGTDIWNTVRIEAGIPRYGADFDETMLAPETRLDAYVAENKGCFRGQEVIARIRNRGHVNRLLAQFRVEGRIVPMRGDPVFLDEREVGWITSPTWSFKHQAPLALGYIRREFSQTGTRVQIQRNRDKLEAMVTEP